MRTAVILFFFALSGFNSQAQTVKTKISILDTSKLNAINVRIQPEVFKGKKSLQVTDKDFDKDTELRIVKLTDTSFHNGIIEAEVAGEPMKNSGESARGFVGIAFRIDNENKKFECIYLRPTNGRADDQVRRNHSVQYISYPEFPWYKLREEAPKKYETYVDLEPGKWTKIKIEVHDNTAKLFVHDATQPTLIVSDLKHGSNMKGSIGLWIGPGTEAHFRNLTVTKKD